MSKQTSAAHIYRETIKNNVCEECKLIPEYHHQFGFYGKSGAPNGYCVNPEQQNRPFTSAKHTSSQGCKQSPLIKVMDINFPHFTIISDHACP
jgi:hypothetical protein